MAEESISSATVVKDSLPLVGVFVGAFLQFVFSRSAEAKKHKEALRVQAYSDYLQSVGEMEAAAHMPDVVARAIGAKARVCVHGSANVVNRVGTRGNTLRKEERMKDA